IANLFVHSDLNCLSVIQFGVEVLKVKHIIVCGHYGCGGIMTALDKKSYGLIDNWLRHIKDLYLSNVKWLEEIESNEERINKLCELNVKQQVINLSHTTV